MGNLSTLVMIDIGENNLRGNIPTEFGKLVNLKEIYLGSNKISGQTPISFYNISGLEIIALTANNLSGTLPPSIGHSFPNLNGFYLGLNQFSGTIPSSISNVSKLSHLDLGRNFLSGGVLMNLGNLQQLKVMNLQRNQLTNDPSTGELGFLTSLSNCKNLEGIQIGFNAFSGKFPKSLAFSNWSNSLERFVAFENGITGEIPSEFSKLSNLTWLSIGKNGIGSLRSLSILDLSRNQFSGEIPSTMGQLQNLVNLSLSMNYFEGLIPESFGDLVALAYLDLSGNNLSGTIPESLVNLKQLSYLNVSFNALTGKIPHGGPFANLIAGSFMGNAELWGPSKFNVVECRIDSPEGRKKRRTLTFVLASIAVALVVTTIFMVWFLKYRKRSRQLPIQI
ncbi:hypothetical protein RND71_012621 [Anisodus tanguticus]|uniref:Uncharacterized protein n=1 Tax=Anisodus tanguticus TaxID=243964 RepID=A0AAE1VPZ9_9SOLA|nr:hypothetical protein RND71_012621 [Anisodus tanguticus]